MLVVGWCDFGFVFMLPLVLAALTSNQSRCNEIGTALYYEEGKDKPVPRELSGSRLIQFAASQLGTLFTLSGCRT